MSDDNNNSNSKLYQHKDFTEMQGFLATIKAKAREKTDKNVLRAPAIAASASAAPGGTSSDNIPNSGGPHANGTEPYIPASKEKLSELDEAIQAMQRSVLLRRRLLGQKSFRPRYITQSRCGSGGSGD